MVTAPYRVDEIDAKSDVPCRCSCCGWEGIAADVADIQDCALTPGDASPIGRCPRSDCGALVYPDREIDRARDNADLMLAAMRQMIAAWDADEDEPDAMAVMKDVLAIVEARPEPGDIPGKPPPPAPEWGMCPCGRVPKSGCDGDNCQEDC